MLCSLQYILNGFKDSAICLVVGLLSRYFSVIREVFLIKFGCIVVFPKKKKKKTRTRVGGVFGLQNDHNASKGEGSQLAVGFLNYCAKLSPKR